MLAQQGTHAFEQVGAGPGGHAAHGVLAEDGFEELGADHAATAGDADLHAGETSREAERGDHHEHGHGVDTQREESGALALAGALLANHVEHRGLPEADFRGHGGRELFLGRGAGGRVGGRVQPVQQGAAGAG